MAAGLCLSCLVFILAALSVKGDPEFCSRGFKMAARFHKCWEHATFGNKYPPLHEPHAFLDGKFMEAYATHMCSIVKPEALKCLDKGIHECTNRKKLMEMADKSGGACLGNGVNPFFKKFVIDRLVPVPGDSKCFEVADNTYECYNHAGQTVMQSGGQSDDIATFHRVADKFFDAYWKCMVEIYKSNEKICPNWQLPMLLTLQKTAMPSLFGLKLRPEQVKNLELLPANGTESDMKGLNPGPSKLYLLLQLHTAKPDLMGREEDSLVVELDDLNDDHPRLQLESGEVDNGKETNPKNFSLKEIKRLLREQRRMNKEMKDFISQANGPSKKKSGRKPSKGKKSYKKPAPKSEESKKKLHADSMVA